MADNIDKKKFYDQYPLLYTLVDLICEFVSNRDEIMHFWANAPEPKDDTILRTKINSPNQRAEIMLQLLLGTPNQHPPEKKHPATSHTQKIAAEMQEYIEKNNITKNEALEIFASGLKDRDLDTDPESARTRLDRAHMLLMRERGGRTDVSEGTQSNPKHAIDESKEWNDYIVSHELDLIRGWLLTHREHIINYLKVN